MSNESNKSQQGEKSTGPAPKLTEAARQKMIDDHAAKKKAEEEAAKKAAASAPAQGGPAVVPEAPKPAKQRVEKPWEDLPPGVIDPAKRAKENTTIWSALKTLEEAGEKGATLEELKEGLKKINMGHHSVKALLRWMNENRGYGFRMNKETQCITHWHPEKLEEGQSVKVDDTGKAVEPKK